LPGVSVAASIAILFALPYRKEGCLFISGSRQLFSGGLPA
jgi:hypothetical protein